MAAFEFNEEELATEPGRFLVLGLQTNATKADIKKRRRELKVFHPDKLHPLLSQATRNRCEHEYIIRRKACDALLGNRQDPSKYDWVLKLWSSDAEAQTWSSQELESALLRLERIQEICTNPPPLRLKKLESANSNSAQLQDISTVLAPALLVAVALALCQWYRNHGQQTGRWITAQRDKTRRSFKILAQAWRSRHDSAIVFRGKLLQYTGQASVPWALCSLTLDVLKALGFHLVLTYACNSYPNQQILDTIDGKISYLGKKNF